LFKEWSPRASPPPRLNDKEHLALVLGEVRDKQNVLTRLHSECFTGDVLGSRRCDCGEQLHFAMQQIAAAGEGILVYLRQEGRGIGLLDKLRAYNLQDEGFDTVEANLLLGHQADERDYTAAARILEDLGVRSVRLLTNNPAKIQTLSELGIVVSERVAVEPTVHAENVHYLFTKVTRMNHMLNLGLFSMPILRNENAPI
jgi:3,4-dihydroxy 2-butanone 4-phosphate synthase/GTP cyclohydrolase II